MTDLLIYLCGLATPVSLWLMYHRPQRRKPQQRHVATYHSFVSGDVYRIVWREDRATEAAETVVRWAADQEISLLPAEAAIMLRVMAERHEVAK